MTTENGNGTAAPLKNVALAVRALERAMTRPQHLPGMVCFYGPSGFGKSVAAAYAANRYRAHYIECKSTWTKKAILTAIAREMGLFPASTMYELTDQISAQLVDTDRPLIIDEMDHIVRREAVEIIRDIYEGSKVAMLLIGEENLPNNLKKSERFHGRILDFVPAQAADASDARVLAKFYCHRVKIADDLLSEVAKRAKGSIRRICVNLARIEEETYAAGNAEIDLSGWNNMGKGFWTGEAVVRGEFVL
jgi:DNA transposition AAA+ family ATPase